MRVTNESHPIASTIDAPRIEQGRLRRRRIRPGRSITCQTFRHPRSCPSRTHVATYAIDGLDGAIVTLITGYGKTDDQEPPPSTV